MKPDRSCKLPITVYFRAVIGGSLAMERPSILPEAQ
jgi:hypothetical protein